MTLAEKKIMQVLKDSGVSFELFEHEPVFTCEQAAQARGVTPADGIKCMLMKANGKLFLVLTRGDKRLDLKKIASLAGAKKLRFANEEEIEKIALCKKGCVHPFCDVKTFVDSALAEQDFIEFNPGCHNKTVRIKVKDLLGLLKGHVVKKISS